MNNEDVVDNNLDDLDQSYQDNQTQKPDKDDTPFSLPDDVEQTIKSTHPATDTNIDLDETYHEGLDEAAEKHYADDDETKSSAAP